MLYYIIIIRLYSPINDGQIRTARPVSLYIDNELLVYHYLYVSKFVTSFYF